MKKLKKDQWKLAATMLEKTATGLGLMLVGLAVTGKLEDGLKAAMFIAFFVITIFFLGYAALECAGKGDTNGDDGDGNNGP